MSVSTVTVEGEKVQRTLLYSILDGLGYSVMVGAGLLGVVVVKLLLIDLSNAGGAERIIAFIAVGVLMLVVGYFAPLPPKLTPKSPPKADAPAAPAAPPLAPSQPETLP